MDDISTAMQIAAAGLRAQSARIRVTAENIANANSTAQAPGLDPYRRQVPVFQAYLDHELGAELVKVIHVTVDPSEFTLRFEPGHPSADENGYITLPNVNPLVEMMDLREAQRSYEAGLGALDTMRSMAAATLRILE